MADSPIPSLDKTINRLKEDPNLMDTLIRSGAVRSNRFVPLDVATPRSLANGITSNSDPKPWDRLSPIPVHLDPFQPTPYLDEQRALSPIGAKSPITENISLFASAAPYMRGGAVVTTAGVSAATPRINMSKDLNIGAEATIGHQNFSSLIGNVPPPPADIKASFDVGIQNPSSGLGFGITGKVAEQANNVQYGIFAAVFGRF